MLKQKEKTEYLTSIENLMPMFREQLEAGKSVAFSPRGISMLPLLRQGIDSVVLSPLPEKLQKYDLPFYRYPDGRYVLHRIVEVRDDYYICRGDNTWRPEKVRPEYLVAVVTSIRRGSREWAVNSPWYWLYCRVWVDSFPVRNFIRRAIGWLKRHL